MLFAHPSNQKRLTKNVLFIGCLWLSMVFFVAWGLVSCSSDTSEREGDEFQHGEQTGDIERGIEQTPSDERLADATLLVDGSPADNITQADISSVDRTENSELPDLRSFRIFIPGAGHGKTRIQPSMAFADDGKFFVAWTGSAENNNLGIYGALYAQDGAELQSPLRIDTYQGGNKIEPQICKLQGGGYIAVWAMDNQTSNPEIPNMEIRYRRIDEQGKPIDPEDIQLTTDVVGNHWMARVVCPDDGGFIVAGSRPDSDGKTFGVFFRRFNANGQAQGTAQQVNTSPDGTQVYPAIAATKSNAVIVAWSDTPAPPDDKDRVMFRFFPPDNQAAHEPLIAAGIAPDTASSPAVSVHPVLGDFVIAAVLNQGRALSLRYYSAQAQYLRDLSLPKHPTPIYNPAIIALPLSGAYALAYMTGTGKDVSVYAVILGVPQVPSEPVLLASGDFPGAYRLFMTYRNGKLAVAWTKRDTSDKSFACQIAFFP